MNLIFAMYLWISIYYDVDHVVLVDADIGIVDVVVVVVVVDGDDDFEFDQHILNWSL